MTYQGNYVDVDQLEGDAYELACEQLCPVQGLLITDGPEAVEIIAGAFPQGGYSLGMAYELRDLILKFNAEHNLTPTVL